MTIAEKLNALRPEMTRSETQLMRTILDGYPISGLCSITELAQKSGVSTPTVGRFVQKLGLQGYAQFQSALREELSEMISDPAAKRNVWKTELPEEHILTRYSRQALENQGRSLTDVDLGEFDRFCDLLADPDRKIVIAGGRITGTLARVLFLHLQMLRPDVRLMSEGVTWLHDMMDVHDGDILVVFDIRRYENTTLNMAQLCHERGAEVVLFTDSWRSPIHAFARLTFSGRVAVPSAWDSIASLLLLVECSVASVQERLWESASARTDALEAAFDRTRLFRKFT